MENKIKKLLVQNKMGECVQLLRQTSDLNDFRKYSDVFKLYNEYEETKRYGCRFYYNVGKEKLEIIKNKIIELFFGDIILTIKDKKPINKKYKLDNKKDFKRQNVKR